MPGAAWAPALPCSVGLAPGRGLAGRPCVHRGREADLPNTGLSSRLSPFCTKVELSSSAVDMSARMCVCVRVCVVQGVGGVSAARPCPAGQL